MNILICIIMLFILFFIIYVRKSLLNNWRRYTVIGIKSNGDQYGIITPLVNKKRDAIKHAKKEHNIEKILRIRKYVSQQYSF